MRADQTPVRILAVFFLVVAGLFLYGCYKAGDLAIKASFAPYNAQLKAAKLVPLSMVDVFRPHVVQGQQWPKKQQACASDCIAQRAVAQATVGLLHMPITWAGGVGLFSLLIGVVLAMRGVAPQPRRNLINLGREEITLRTQADTLPILRQGRHQWGVMRRPWLQKAGRREFGNGIFVGPPGAGKSSLLKTWLLTSDDLNFVVVDLKGDLWKETAGYRSTLGDVLRLDLSSLTGDALDPLATEEQAAMAIFEILLPTSVPAKAHFPSGAQQIALAYWKAARATGVPAISVLVQAATSRAEDMVGLARRLMASAPEDSRAELLAAFQGAFAEVWDDPVHGTAGEKGSMLSSFRTAFAPLNTPEIQSTLASRTFDPRVLVNRRSTLYITAPSTDTPYKLPLEMLLGAVIEEIFTHCDQHGAGEEIILLADEAGVLKVPRFGTILASGRSRNVTVAAFVQDLGQLRQYHQDGWAGLTDTFHHWTFWGPRNMQARAYLRDQCGKYEVPNPEYDSRKRNRRFLEIDAFDELDAAWTEDKVLALLNYQRHYVVYGEFVTPFQGPAKLRRALKAPALPTLPLPGKVMEPETSTQKQTPSPQPVSAPPAPDAAGMAGMMKELDDSF